MIRRRMLLLISGALALGACSSPPQAADSLTRIRLPVGYFLVGLAVIGLAIVVAYAVGHERAERRIANLALCTCL